MARGNQRDKAREKNQKELSAQVNFPPPTMSPLGAWHNPQSLYKIQLTVSQKKKNNQTGTEFQRTKEQQAAIMRQKQEEADRKKQAEKK